MEKWCWQCGETKDVSEYSKNSARPDGLQDRCKLCANTTSRQNYEDNKDRYKAKAQLRTVELRARIAEMKSVPCADCKQTFDPVCMDFDHLPEHEKEMNISYMLRRKMAWEKILAEIQKCQVVCANCHRLRTKRRAMEELV